MIFQPTDNTFGRIKDWEKGEAKPCEGVVHAGESLQIPAGDGVAELTCAAAAVRVKPLYFFSLAERRQTKKKKGNGK